MFGQGPDCAWPYDASPGHCTRMDEADWCSAPQAFRRPKNASKPNKTRSHLRLKWTWAGLMAGPEFGITGTAHDAQKKKASIGIVFVGPQNACLQDLPKQHLVVLAQGNVRCNPMPLAVSPPICRGKDETPAPPDQAATARSPLALQPASATIDNELHTHLCDRCTHNARYPALDGGLRSLPIEAMHTLTWQGGP